MTLSTLINAGLTRPSQARMALVLMGGGARTAYQAGVLQALADMLRVQTPASATEKAAIAGVTQSAAQRFPFQILVGTSAGALNATFLAARATQGLAAMDALAQFWRGLRSHQVYQLDVPVWVRLSKIAAAWSLSKQIRGHGALLNNMPMVDTLHRAIPLAGIDDALSSHVLHALAVTASSYTSGVHWTFCHTAHDEDEQPWLRPGRRAELGPITIEHLMASSAIPLIFPATPLWVDHGREFFGDVGQPQRSSFAGSNPTATAQAPGLGGIMGHAMASVFHDTLQGDVEQAQRMNATLAQLPREVAAVMPYRSVQVMCLQPSGSLDDLAQRYVGELPQTARSVLAGLGALGHSGNQGAGSGAASLASYLLFEPGFVGALMDMGQRDAYAQKTALLEFFSA
jgi:NTE family protein